jgi:hypothetical protein
VDIPYIGALQRHPQKIEFIIIGALDQMLTVLKGRENVIANQ